MFSFTAVNPIHAGHTRLPNLAGAILMAVVASLLVGLGGSSPAFADDSNASISGNVKGAGIPNTSLEHVWVSAMLADGTQVKSAETNAVGDYTISGLHGGEYTLHLETSNDTKPYLSEYWGGAMTIPAASFFTLSPGEAATDKNAVLKLGATISGNVKRPGAPPTNVEGITVHAYGAYNYEGQALTDANGNYTIVGLGSGRYTLKFDSSLSENVILQYWGGGMDASTAESFSVIVGQTITGKNVIMAPGATISGNIKDSGDPATNHDGVFVELHRVETSDVEFSNLGTTTDENGNYELLAVQPGEYTLAFYPNSGDPFMTQFWGGTSNYLNAEFFTVSIGQTLSDMNIVLPHPGTVTGTVYAAGSPNVPLEGVSVRVVDPNWSAFNVLSRTTGADGTYIFDNVEPGTYTLSFARDGYATAYWDAKSSLGEATTFTVTSGLLVSGKDAVLAPGSASVSGNVQGLGTPNHSLLGAWVKLLDSDGNEAGAGITDSSGNYSVPVVYPGSYTLKFLSPVGQNYADEWWNDQQSAASGNYFAVASGQTLTAMDAVLATGGTVSGTLTDSAGTPMGGEVRAYRSGGSGANSETFVSYVRVVNVGGSYEITGLPVGSYVLMFTQGSLHDLTFPSYPYVTQWSGGKYSYDTAVPVVITTPGQVVPGMDAALEYPSFEDVDYPLSSFYDFIQWMSSSGLSTGTVQSEGKPLYKPSAAVSRQAMAAFLYRLSGSTFTPPGDPTFADVPTGSAFYTAIEWMAHEGISTGTAQPSGKPLFKATDPVSRMAMALFLARYEHADLSGTPSVQRFADVPLNSSPAAAITWMWDNGISTGTTQPSGLPLYKPSDPVSRQAMAAFLYRVAHLVV